MVVTAAAGRDRMVARERELAQFDQALDHLNRGDTRLVEVVGEPGLGKTRLLEEFRRRAERRELVVLPGQASERDLAIPFGVLLDAFGERVTALDAGWPGDGPPDAGTDRCRRYRAARAQLEALAGDRGVVLMLDDVHWADTASVEFLAHLVGHPLRVPLLVVVAHRPRQARPHLLAALGRAAETGNALRLELGPLTAEQTAELLGGTVSAARRRELYAASGGVPFYALALARGGSAGTAAGAAAGRRRGDPMPHAVRSALLAELTQLGPVAQLVAWSTAVAGDPFEPSLVARIAQVSTEDALGAIDTLVERDLLRPDGANRFRYRHPLLREVVYASSGAGWRVAAHSRAAGALARQGAPLDVRAHHVQRSANPGDIEAATLLREAAGSVLSRAPGLAADWLRTALRLLPEDLLSEDRAAAGVGPGAGPRAGVLLCELSGALGLAGQLQAARDTGHEALRLLPRAGDGQRTRAVTFCATMDRLMGRHAEARALLLRELASQPDADTVETAALQLELAVGSFMQADYRANRALAERSLRLAKRHDLRALQATALGFLAAAAFADTDVAGATRQLEEAAALVDAMADHELAERIEAALWLGWNETYLERFHDALRHLDRGLALAHATGQTYVLTQFQTSRVTVLRWLGRLPEAGVAAAAAVDTAELAGSDELRSIAQSAQSWIASWTGDVALALAAGERAVAAAGARRGWFTTLAAAMLARARVAAGDAGDAGELLLARLGGTDLPAVDPWTRGTWYEVLVRAELARGRRKEAAAWATRAREYANRLGLRAHAGLALLAEAQVRAADGAKDEAATHALAAADAFELAECRLDQGRSLLLAGTNLADPVHALAVLRQAETVLADCGASALQGTAVKERRRLAARRRREDDEAPDPVDAALTRREREVAKLVSEGLSNREIAGRLYVTPKTVEAHLSRVFAKLGVSTRAAVAAMVVRRPYGNATG